jgi:hypothetical protein
MLIPQKATLSIRMSADGYSEAAQGHWGKKGRMERGSKMFGTIKHLVCQLVVER